jgi:SAM-dependent methyltransferase
MTATTATPDLRLCTVCGSACAKFRPGPHGTRLDASCPGCGALERHRFLALVVPALVAHASSTGSINGTGSSPRGVLLDVAPMRGTTPLLKATVPYQYVGIDFDPAADRRVVDVTGSLTNVPLADASVSLLICMQVLEHIPDDAAAMHEIARVLAPGATAIVQVPRRRGIPTDEDPSVGPEERLARFGQADHVRYYGDDFEDRLRAAGLSIEIVTGRDLIDEASAVLLGLPLTETLWLCGRAGTGPQDLTSALRAAMPSVLATMLARSASTALAERTRLEATLAQTSPRQRRPLHRRALSYAARKVRR